MKEEKITHTRRINNKVWLEEACRLMTVAFIFVVISRLAMYFGLTEEIAVRLVGSTGMIGYLLFSGLRLMEHEEPKYWIYTKIEESE